MHIPEIMPVLSAGAHDRPEDGACVMELVSYLAGEAWSDRPACTHPVLARAAQVVNDRLPDSERHRLVPLIGRLFGTGESGTEHERKVLSVRLAAWCAREVLPLTSESARPAALAAIEAAEGWRAGQVTEQECRTAATDATAATAATANAADTAAAYAAAAANVQVEFLTRLLDHYDHLTGRTQPRVVTDDEWTALATLTR